MHIAIITARGGSKRIPRKNIKDFLGKPIIAYTIETARRSGLFQEIMVSTDDEEIATIAKQYGAKVPFLRSEATASDHATTAEVLQEVLQEYEKIGKKFKIACCIYPTAPFITTKLLKKAFGLLESKTFDCVYPIQAFSFPVQRAVCLQESKVAWYQPEYALTRSQDLEPMYHDAGQFYLFRVKSFVEKGSVITDHTGAVIISEMEAQDIDNETDWELAELKYKLR
jgi:pseudaminic acid cytidylyltransferase